jgi:hypothetical protein
LPLGRFPDPDRCFAPFLPVQVTLVPKMLAGANV